MKLIHVALIFLALSGFIYYQNKKNEALDLQTYKILQDSQPNPLQNPQTSLQQEIVQAQPTQSSVITPQATAPKKGDLLPPAPTISETPEMQNFQQSPEFKEFVETLDRSLNKYITNEALRNKIGLHLKKQISRPINLANPSPKEVLKLSQFEKTDLKEAIQEAAQSKERDQQTLDLLVTIALDAEEDSRLKADIIAKSMDVTVKDETEMHFLLQSSLAKVRSHNLSKDDIKPELEKLLKKQTDPKVREVFETTLKQNGLN